MKCQRGKEVTVYELALCAGIGAMSRGLQDAGIRTACYVERNEYRINVLIARMQDGSLDQAPIWDDVTTFDGRPWCGRVDLIAAGYPCQPFSRAGLKRGTDDERYLWPDVCRIIRQVRPCYVLLENVSDLLVASGKRPAPISDVLSDLATSGYDAEWSVLPAALFGAPHLRERVFVVAYSYQGRRQAVLRALAHASRETYAGWPSNHLDTPGDYLQAMEERLCEPAIFGSNDGTASRVERLEAIGEAVVRQIAAAVGTCLVKDWQAVGAGAEMGAARLIKHPWELEACVACD